MGKIKIYDIDGCEWWAGRSVSEVLQAYTEEYNIPVSDDVNIKELSQTDMNKMIYIDDPYSVDNAGERSFADQLQIMIAENCEFPCMFATTEF